MSPALSLLLASALFGPQPAQERPAVERGQVALTLAAVGDVMLGSNFPSAADLPPKRAKLLDPAAPILREADLAFANFEGVALNSGGKPKAAAKSKYVYMFRQPEYLLDQVKDAGIDLLSVANNHSSDFGEAGRRSTAKALRKRGLFFAGYTRNPKVSLVKNGLRVGFAAFAPHPNCPDPRDSSLVKKVVSDLAASSNVVIISVHAGAEGAAARRVPKRSETYLGYDRGDVYKFARLAIDHGADVVIGHGPHVPRAFDLYKGRFIAYSLGNFCTYGQFNLTGTNGLAPIVRLGLDAEGALLEGSVVSMRQKGRGGPVPDPTNAALAEIRELTALDAPDSGLVWDSSGAFHPE